MEPEHPDELRRVAGLRGEREERADDRGWVTCTYDSNGNLTYRVYDATGPKSYVHDDENQLIEMRTDTSATPTGSRWRTTWLYDGLGRARKRNDFTWYGSPGGWYNAGETFYIYDGMRVIQERCYGNPSVSYTRGNELSGSLESAGGIGRVAGPITRLFLRHSGKELNSRRSEAVEVPTLSGSGV